MVGMMTHTHTHAHEAAHGLPDVFSYGMNTLHDRVQNTCH